MKTPPHAFGTVYEIAFIVDDLEKAAASWQRAGAGPFYSFPDFGFIDVQVPEEGSAPRISLFVGYSGATMIELIKVDDDPNKLFSCCRPGEMHHVGLLVENLDHYLSAPGNSAAPVIFRAGFAEGETPIVFMDTRPQIGVFTELVTYDGMVADMLEEMATESKKFSGGRLIRSFES